MKQFLLSSLVLFASTLAYADEQPTITLKAEVDGNTRTFTFAMATTASTIQIDWGDGNLVTTEEIPVSDGWTYKEITGTPLNEGVIKIYGADLAQFETPSTVTGAKITKLDVTNAKELTSLTANTNSIKSIDLSNNTKLEKLLLNGNLIETIDLTANPELTSVNLQENKLSTIDLSKNPKIATLYLSQNKLKTLDLSANTKIKNLYLMSNELESISLGDNTTLSYISVNYNKLTELDLSKHTGLGSKASVFAIGNNLKVLLLPDQQVNRVTVTNNKFDLATLTEYFSKVKTLTYAPQQDYEIATEIQKKLDLSSQAKVGDVATEFTVKTASGTTLTAGTDYSITDGVISFLTEQTDSVYVEMSNTAYPKFTDTNVFKTTKAAIASVVNGIAGVSVDAADAQAEYFTLDGKRVNSPNQQGVYIERKGNAVRKVVVN